MKIRITLKTFIFRIWFIMLGIDVELENVKWFCFNYYRKKDNEHKITENIAKNKVLTFNLFTKYRLQGFDFLNLLFFMTHFSL